MRTISLLTIALLMPSVSRGDDKEKKEEAALAAWRKGAAATEKRQEDNYKKLMTTRVDELARICELSEEQLDRFRLAAKGAIERSLDAYMDYQEKQFLRRQRGNRGAIPQLKPEDQNPSLRKIWLDSIASELQPDQKKTYDEEMDARVRFYADVIIRQIVQQLDDQTRMSAKQRQLLTGLMEETIPLPEATGAINRNSVQIAVYKGLAKVPDEPLQKGLSKGQFGVWKEYRDRYARIYKNR